MLKRKYILLTMGIPLILSACGGRNASTIEIVTEVQETFLTENSTIVEEEEPQYLSLQEYSGYLDEYKSCIFADSFANQDYDVDGQIDRVYREFYRDTQKCDFYVEMGNGDVLKVPEQNNDCIPTFLYIESSDNQNSFMIYQIFYPGAVGMGSINNDVAIYKKDNSEYVMCELPFSQSKYDQSSFQQYVNVSCYAENNFEVTYKCKEFPEFEETIVMAKEDFEYGDMKALYGENGSFSNVFEEHKVYSITKYEEMEDAYLCVAHVAYHCLDEIAFLIQFNGEEWLVEDVFMINNMQ